MAPSRKAPSKASKSPTPKKSTPKTPAKDAARPEPAAAPEFVRAATAAERKAALEAVIEQQGVEAIVDTRPTTPPPLPPVVRESSPADRKAAVESLVESSGVAGVLRKAPWKRSTEAPPPPPAPAVPAAPSTDRPRAVMTKAPLEQTTGRSAPRVVILDANALMMQFQFHVDIEKEVGRVLSFAHEIVVPTIVVKELSRIAREGNQKEATEARMAVELAKTFRVEESGDDGDTAILRLAEKLNAVVVTNDKRLRARLRAKDLANIHMRNRAFLTLEGHIPGT